MKKSIAALIVSTLAGTSGLSYAADNTVAQLSSGVYVENDATGCSVLRDRVTVNLSNGVTMAYNCITALAKVNVAACHSSGSQKPTQVDCVVTGTNEDDTPAYNGADCNDAGQLTDPKQKTTIAGRRGFTGSTTGGSVGATSLNSTTCDVAALGALEGITK